MLASTFTDYMINQVDVQAFANSQADSQLVKGYQYFKVCDEHQLEYILVVHGLSLIHIFLIQNCHQALNIYLSNSKKPVLR